MAEKIMLIIIMVLMISVVAETLRLGLKNGIFQPYNPFGRVKIWKRLKKALSFRKIGQCRVCRRASESNEAWNNIWQGRMK